MIVNRDIMLYAAGGYFIGTAHAYFVNSVMTNSQNRYYKKHRPDLKITYPHQNIFNTLPGWIGLFSGMAIGWVITKDKFFLEW
tara:strand:- start:2020 stop:2268 length:249 start_codon:yes stop_codon:yes gene_type:complete